METHNKRKSVWEILMTFKDVIALIHAIFQFVAFIIIFVVLFTIYSEVNEVMDKIQSIVPKIKFG